MIIRTLSAVLAALLLTAPAAAEVVQQGPNAFTTRDSVVVKASRFEVWQALIAPAGWWNKAHTWSGDAENLYISAQANGCFCELLPAPKGAPAEVRRGSALHMIVIQADPGHVLRMRGGLGPLQSEPAEGVLTIALGEVEGGTRIVWEYVVGGSMRYEVPVISKAVDGVMSEQLRGLARLLGPVAAENKPAAKPDGKPEPEGKAPAGKASAERAAPDKAPAKPKVEEAFGDLIGEE